MKESDDVPGLERFRSALGDEARRILLSKGAPAIREFTRGLFRGTGPTAPPSRLSRDEEYARFLALEFSEIANTLLSLRDVVVYLRRFPYGGTSVSKTRHLRHNVETFFHECYILHCRLLDFMKKLERKFRGRPQATALEAARSSLADLVTHVLEPVIDIRGGHVHARRYDEPDLMELEGLELLEGEGADLLADYMNAEYKRVRGKWRDLVEASVGAVEKMADHYFSVLMLVLFDEDGRMVYPSSAGSLT